MGGRAPERSGGRRSTALSGALLAVLLGGAAVVARVATPADGPTATSPPTSALASPAPAATAGPTPSAPAAPASPSPSPPGPGAAYPVRQVGALADRTRIVSGEGNAELRYARTAGQATRVHLICTGCDADTWLVEWPRGAALGGGPLADPSDATGALDTEDPGRTTRLLVRARADASWTVTLTPFDVVPVHRAGFDGLGDDVVAVRARGEVQLRCAGGPRVQTLARPTGQAEYAVVETLRSDVGGTYLLRVPEGADLIVVVVSCAGRWTVTLP